LSQQYGDRLHYVACDVSKTARIDDLIAAAHARFGPRRCWKATKRCTTGCSR
jgi:NAD(P)-dependent dehydrogenase (short-subunit alcohol dehydrogenase family)